jgi:nicotinamide riboside kinase
MGMRIAITGSAGVGKSTLGRRLGEILGVPVLGEGMREWLERTGSDLHALGRDGVRSLLVRLWEERRAAEETNQAFVADRSSYDFGAFWLYYQFGGQDAETERLLAECFSPGRYDTVYLIPWGSIPLVADGVRSSDRYVQLHSQLLIEGAVRRYAGRVVEVVATRLDDRVEAVLADIRALAEGRRAR